MVKRWPEDTQTPQKCTRVQRKHPFQAKTRKYYIWRPIVILPQFLTRFCIRVQVKKKKFRNPNPLPGKWMKNASSFAHWACAALFLCDWPHAARFYRYKVAIFHHFTTTRDQQHRSYRTDTQTHTHQHTHTHTHTSSFFEFIHASWNFSEWKSYAIGSTPGHCAPLPWRSLRSTCPACLT